MKPPAQRSLRISDAAKAASVSPVRKEFNRLVRKLETSRARLAAWQAAMPVAQRRIDEEYDPAVDAYDARLRQLVLLLDKMITHKSLTRSEREKLEIWLADTAAGLLAEAEDDNELKEIYRRHTGEDFDEGIEEDDAEFADMMANMLGVKLDADAAKSPEAVLEALAEQWEERATQAQAAAEAKAAKRPKSAAALAREHRQEIEAEKLKQSVREIFRKLASALHPDREADPAERERKTALMQRVNVAYRANDILALLELQLEIEQIDVAGLNGISDERIRQYNRILDGQVVEIMSKIYDFEYVAVEMLDHPDLRKLTPEILLKTLADDIADLQKQMTEVQEDLENFQDVKKLKAWLKTFRLTKYDDGY